MQRYRNQRRTSMESDDSSMAGQAWQFDYKVQGKLAQKVTQPSRYRILHALARLACRITHLHDVPDTPRACRSSVSASRSCCKPMLLEVKPKQRGLYSHIITV